MLSGFRPGPAKTRKFRKEIKYLAPISTSCSPPEKDKYELSDNLSTKIFFKRIFSFILKNEWDYGRNKEISLDIEIL